MEGQNQNPLYSQKNENRKGGIRDLDSFFSPWAVLCFRCCLGFSLVAAGRGYPLVAMFGPLIAVASLIAEDGCEGTWASVVAARGLSSCDFRALEHRLNSCGAHAAQHVGSSWTRERTHVSGNGRWILIHCATKEVHLLSIFKGICSRKLI